MGKVIVQTKTLEERVAEKMAKEIGDMITTDDMRGMVKEGIRKAMFTERTAAQVQDLSHLGSANSHSPGGGSRQPGRCDRNVPPSRSGERSRLDLYVLSISSNTLNRSQTATATSGCTPGRPTRIIRPHFTPTRSRKRGEF